MSQSAIEVSTDKINTPSGRFVSRRINRNSAKKLKTAFKPPLRRDVDKASQSQSTGTDLGDLQKEMDELRQKESELDTEIEQLQSQGYKAEELQAHISKLHEYNEIKDTGQMLLGRIALREGLTTKDLYERYNLDLED